MEARGRQLAQQRLLEWRVSGHPQIDDQHEIDRFVAGRQSLIAIHYVKKTPSLTAAERQKWLDILDRATVR